MIHRIFITALILLTVAASALIYVLNDNKAGSDFNSPSSLALKQVIIYSRTGCSYCINAKALLDKKGIKYESIDLDNNPDLYNKLISQTGQRTVPYIFINDKFIGGFTDLNTFLTKNNN